LAVGGNRLTVFDSNDFIVGGIVATFPVEDAAKLGLPFVRVNAAREFSSSEGAHTLPALCHCRILIY